MKNATTKTFRFVSSAGVDMGTYPGTTKEEALAKMAFDAGYDDRPEDCDGNAITFDGTIIEVEV